MKSKFEQIVPQLAIVLVVLSIYAFNRFVIKPNIGIEGASWFFICYFNDLLAPISFLAFGNIFVGMIFGRNIRNLGWLLLIAFVAGLEWEFVTPLYRSDSVTDPYDMLMYMFGAMIYWRINLQLKNAKKSSETARPPIPAREDTYAHE